MRRAELMYYLAKTCALHKRKATRSTSSPEREYHEGAFSAYLDMYELLIGGAPVSEKEAKRVLDSQRRRKKS